MSKKFKFKVKKLETYAKLTGEPLNGQPVSKSNTIERPEQAGGNKEALTAAFSAFDDDKDGLISPTDLRKALQKFGYEMGEDEAIEIIKSNSSASDMYISYLEFYQIMEQKMTETSQTESKTDDKLNKK